MKTKLLSLPDWQEALRQLGWADAPNGDDVQNQVRRELTRGKVTFGAQAPGTPIEKGCRVTLRTESILPKFNKEKTSVTVGSGLYDAAVEARLLGMTLGDRAEVTVKGEKVAFSVEKVENKQFPALTDALVQELDLEGIRDLATYYCHTEEQMRSRYAQGLAARLVDRLLSCTEIETPDPEDIRRVTDLEYEPLRVRFGLDELTPEKWKEDLGRVEMRQFYEQIYPEMAILFGTTGKESFYESRQEAARGKIRTCLVLNRILGSDQDPTEDPKAEETLMQTFSARLLDIIYGG